MEKPVNTKGSGFPSNRSPQGYFDERLCWLLGKQLEVPFNPLVSAAPKQDLGAVSSAGLSRFTAGHVIAVT